MSTITETVEILAPTEHVFGYVDDMRNVGWHMTERSSAAMLGSRLKLEILSEQATGPGATYRYSGTMMGLTLDFSESVTKYVPNREKVWRTIGTPRLLIIDSYEMRIVVEPISRAASRLTIAIDYQLPRSPFWRVLGAVLAGPYSRWCLRQMVGDAKRALESRVQERSLEHRS